MTIQQFLQKAIEGGWEPIGYNFSNKPFSWKVQAVCKVKYKERFFLDPKLWEAVGKTEGWEDKCKICGENHFPKKIETKEYVMHRHVPDPAWINKMHRMIDALCEGKTVQEYIESL